MPSRSSPSKPIFSSGRKGSLNAVKLFFTPKLKRDAQPVPNGSARAILRIPWPFQSVEGGAARLERLKSEQKSTKVVLGVIGTGNQQRCRRQWEKDEGFAHSNKYGAGLQIG
jgi:hypothetical protein